MTEDPDKKMSMEMINANANTTAHQLPLNDHKCLLY